MGGILSVYNMLLESCICESAVTFCNWSQGRTLKGLLVFALLNKYPKILEIPKYHLCTPVHCIQNNCANTAVSHVNSKIVFIYQGTNMGLQKLKLSLDAVEGYRAVPGCHQAWGLWHLQAFQCHRDVQSPRAWSICLESSETQTWDKGEYQTKTSERAKLGPKHITANCNSNSQTAVRKLL